MTPGKAGGLLGEPLKGADKTVSRPRRQRFLLPLQGEGWDGGGVALCVSAPPPKPIPTPTLPLKGRELQQSSPSAHDRRIGQTLVSPPAEPGVYLTELSDDEVKAAVDYMVWYSMPKPHNPFGSQVFSATTKQFTMR